MSLCISRNLVGVSCLEARKLTEPLWNAWDERPTVGDYAPTGQTLNHVIGSRYWLVALRLLHELSQDLVQSCKKLD